MEISTYTARRGGNCCGGSNWAPAKGAKVEVAPGSPGFGVGAGVGIGVLLPSASYELLAAVWGTHRGTPFFAVRHSRHEAVE